MKKEMITVLGLLLLLFCDNGIFAQDSIISYDTIRFKVDYPYNK